MPDQTNEVMRHGVLNIISSTGITLIGFFATMFYAHSVGAGILGAYFVFLSAYAILSLFCDFGINLASTQRISDGGDPDAYYSATIIMRMSLFAVLTIGLFIFKDFLFQGKYASLNSPEIFYILIFVLGISTLGSCVSSGIGASNRLGLCATTSLINNIVKIVLQVLAVCIGLSLYGLVGGLIAGILVQLAIELFFIDYHMTRISLKHIKGLFSYSRWAFLITICLILFDYLTPLIIALFLPLSEVGIFGVCWTFSIFALFISTAFYNTLYVKVIYWTLEKDYNALTLSLEQAVTYSLVFALPILAGGIILGERLLYYFYGAGFAAGAAILSIIILMRVFQSLSQLFIRYLMSANQVRRAFAGLCAGISVNMFLACILIPSFGLTGAAVASLANIIILVLVSAYYLKDLFPLRFETARITSYIFFSTCMGAFLLVLDFVYPVNNAFITLFRVAAGAAVYCAAILLFDHRIREDILRLLKIQWIPAQ